MWPSAKHLSNQALLLPICWVGYWFSAKWETIVNWKSRNCFVSVVCRDICLRLRSLYQLLWNCESYNKRKYTFRNIRFWNEIVLQTTFVIFTDVTERLHNRELKSSKFNMLISKNYDCKTFLFFNQNKHIYRFD